MVRLLEGKSHAIRVLICAVIYCKHLEILREKSKASDQ